MAKVEDDDEPFKEKDEWIERVIQHPLREERQADGRI
jgi:hypothetical protein